MRKKNVIAFAILMILFAGCSQSDSKGKTTGDQSGISNDHTESKNSTKDSDKKDKAAEQSDESKEPNKSESDNSGSQEKQTIEKQNTDKATTSKQSNSSQTKPSPTNDGNKQQSPQQEQPKQEQQQQETAKPSEPKPPAPTCNDTLPAGAYPIAREAEIDAKVQAEMIDNQVNGDGTFKRYEVEYGTTECGTEYFYIIYHKY